MSRVEQVHRGLTPLETRRFGNFQISKRLLILGVKRTHTRTHRRAWTTFSADVNHWFLYSFQVVKLSFTHWLQIKSLVESCRM